MNLFTEIQLQRANDLSHWAYSLRVGKLLNNLKFDYVKN